MKPLTNAASMAFMYSCAAAFQLYCPLLDNPNVFSELSGIEILLRYPHNYFIAVVFSVAMFLQLRLMGKLIEFENKHGRT